MSYLIPDNLVTAVNEKEMSIDKKLDAVTSLYDVAIAGDWGNDVSHYKISYPEKAANQAQIVAVKRGRALDITPDSTDEEKLKMQIVRMKAAVSQRIKIQPDWQDQGAVIYLISKLPDDIRHLVQSITSPELNRSA